MFTCKLAINKKNRVKTDYLHLHILELDAISVARESLICFIMNKRCLNANLEENKKQNIFIVQVVNTQKSHLMARWLGTSIVWGSCCPRDRHRGTLVHLELPRNPYSIIQKSALLLWSRGTIRNRSYHAICSLTRYLNVSKLNVP